MAALQASRRVRAVQLERERRALVEGLFSMAEADRPNAVHRLTAIGIELDMLAHRPAGEVRRG